MRTAPSLETLRAEAAAATARGSKSFFFATRFFPQPLAESAHAVYWFCRHTDDLVDEAPSLAAGHIQLEQWASEVECALRAGESSHPILTLFLDAVHRHCIPHEYPLELIEGMRMDLRRTRYRTFEELRVFCYRVASVVGLMMSHVIGFRAPALTHAIDLGIAMQLTNILRDVGEDLRMGRIYLPEEDLDRFSYSASDLKAQRNDAAFRQLMQFQIGRARTFYEQAMPGIAMLNPEGRFAVRIAADVYRQILCRIEDTGYDVFERRAVVPVTTKYWLTAKSMALPIARQSLQRLAVWRS